MKKESFVGRLGRVLPRWLGWGAACGSLSLMCACVFGDGGAWALVAMGLGIVTWSVVCAAVTASEAYDERAAAGCWDESLRLGLSIRAGGTLLGAIVMVAGLLVPWIAGVNWLILPDFWAGMVSIQAGHWISGGVGGMTGEAPRDFAVTYVTTMVQGVWVVGSIVVVASIVHAVRKRLPRAQVARTLRAHEPIREQDRGAI